MLRDSVGVGVAKPLRLNLSKLLWARCTAARFHYNCGTTEQSKVGFTLWKFLEFCHSMAIATT